jgi:hypothetical protein
VKAAVDGEGLSALEKIRNEALADKLIEITTFDKVGPMLSLFEISKGLWWMSARVNRWNDDHKRVTAWCLQSLDSSKSCG